ncbi:MAG: sulfatase-like hydrolase/transferase [Armatimonadota bacterium]|nr:sulfatase-like hydrolase/transferase [Armatimonadota bacterium]
MNLLILCPDQLRADYLSCYGHPTIATRNIDQLAAEGVRFEKAYCAAPLCGPSRISFVTSTRFSEHNHRNYGSTIDYRVPNLVRCLKEAGYRTAMFGKNHCFTYEQLPHIWDELHEICLGNYDKHPKYQRSFDAFPLEQDHEYNITGLLADEAISFIRRQGDKPWLCWVNWQDPHPAFTCPEPYFSMFDRSSIEIPTGYREAAAKNKPRRLKNWQVNSLAQDATDDEIRNAIAAYMGQVRYVDDSVGRILDALEETGQSNDTLVVFFADHGELLGDQGAFHKLGVFYECLTRIPVIIRHPYREYKGIFQGLVEEVDLAPTILDALGIPKPPTFVGESLHQKLLEGKLGKEHGRPTALVETGLQAPTWPTPVGYNQKAPFAPNNFGPGAMLTDGRFKLSIYYDDVCELYDLEYDPRELENRFDDPRLKHVRDQLTLELCKRLMGIGVRDIGRIDWPEPDGDPRDTPIEVIALRRPMKGKHT